MAFSLKRIKTFSAGLALSTAFFAAANAATGGTGTYQLPDMSAHPLAGSEVDIQIRVKDALGQEGRSKTIRVTLPQVKFRNPLNPSLAALRKALALDSRQSGAVAESLAMLLRETPPENKDIENRLHHIHQNMISAGSVDSLEQAIHDLWQVMMQLEEESMTEAEKNLREAERKLQEGIKKGLSPEELKKLAEDMQKAMEEYLKEQAEQAENPEDKETLEEMRKMMEEMRKLQEEMEGMSQDAAQKMLNQMQQMQQKGQSQSQMKKNMQQQMQEMQKQLQEMKEMKERLDALKKIIENQENVTNKTKEEVDRRETGRVDLDNIQRELEGFSKHLRERADIWKDIKKNTKGERIFENISKEADSIHKKLIEEQKNGKALTQDDAENQIKTLKKLHEKFQNQVLKESIDDSYYSEPLKKDDPEAGKSQNIQEQMDQLNKDANRGHRSSDIRNQQNSVRWDLNRMIRDIKSKGDDASKLEDARRQMEEAIDQLNQNNPDKAVPYQDKALEALLDAQQEMQQQMQQQMGAGAGQGAPELGSRGGDLQTSPDPLGRSNPNAHMGVNPQQGAHHGREAMDKIRDRLESPHIDQRDREYLERLLRKPGQNGPAL